MRTFLWTKRRARTLLLGMGGALVAGLVLPFGAAAQLNEDLLPPEKNFVSPEQLLVELRVGPYVPDEPTGAFDEILGEDVGPLLELELDVIAYRLKDILYVTGGGALGWASFSEAALSATDRSQTSEDTDLDLIPLSLLVGVRVDALPRLFEIPLIVTGKLGYSWVHWSASTGGFEDASGVAHGFRWGLQGALDLDTFEPRAARAMDEEWGINHSYAFFELTGFSPSGDSFEVGGVNWVAGLGFVL
ncbi:MAG: MXAN_2562 family outer membrane beta-barrel protein [Myxococcales bacterium]|nr:MXAN_2562 family outer membrane beta-barrel protein [Myxococcales bacterium]MDD9966490.1 MXAN_2562 family outer membrane beta-barrel protein [Myxococcales bacterium]